MGLFWILEDWEGCSSSWYSLPSLELVPSDIPKA